MKNFYVRNKRVGEPHPKKLIQEKFVTDEQFKRILKLIKESGHQHARRDHCCIYLGFFFAMRAGECAMLERKWFRDIDDGIVYIPRLKRIPRIPWQCPACGKKVKVSHKKIKQPHECPKCGTEKQVTYEGPRLDLNPPETIPPLMEDQVIVYIKEYLENMKPDQRWLLEGRPGRALSDRAIRYIWDTYASMAKLSSKVSFHALRHGRGAQLWDAFRDQQLVKDMLGHANIGASAFYIHNNPKLLKSRQKELEAKMKGIQ